MTFIQPVNAAVSAALPPHTAESLRLSDVLFLRTCGEAEPRRNSKR